MRGTVHPSPKEDKGKPMAIEDSDIEALGQTPKRVRTEEGTVEERSVQELIDADRYAKTKTAVDAVPWGMRIARSKPPSALG